MNPLTALRNWLFRPVMSQFDVMRKLWHTMPKTCHIVRRSDGVYYFYVHTGEDWCRYCGTVIDFDQPDLQNEIADSYGE